MPFSQVLFGFQGRLARLPFFGYSILVFFLLGVSIIAGGAMIGVDSGGGGAVLGGLVIFAAIIGGIWAGLALTIKRLHDMGLAGTHAIWIYGLNVASGAVGTAFSSALLRSVLLSGSGLGRVSPMQTTMVQCRALLLFPVGSQFNA
jgi:uncharacterized membrane protein YhaH (DUF805 family)